VPPVPNYKLSMSIPEWLQAIQTYMKMLQYPSPVCGLLTEGWLVPGMN